MGESHYVLEILSATGESSSRTLQPEGVIIGRRKGEIIIDDAGASGRHAELQLQGDAVEVRDLGSTNGIVWGGSIVRDPFQVAVGETFQIGRTKFTVKAIHHPEPAPVAEPEVEEGDDEEATAFISAADLGMEDLSPEPVVQAPEPVVQAPEPVVQAPEPVVQAPEPVVQAPEPVVQAPEPVVQAPEPVEEDDEEEEATAWMTAMDDDAPSTPDAVVDWRDAAPTPTTPGDWADEPAPQPATAQSPQSAPQSEAKSAAQTDPDTVLDQPPIAASGQDVVVIGERRPNFQGEGGEIFKLFFLHALLTVVTFGIYTPWFICKGMKYLASRTVFGPTQGGWVYARFHGEGGALFVKFIVGYLLTLVTFGIYGAWFICDMARWFLERSDAVAEDGTVYQAQFNMTGGQLLPLLLVNYLLTMVTFGIYGAWAYCKVRAKVVEQIHIFENGEHVGGCQFTATGGSLLPYALVQWLLCCVTLFIYVPWAVVNMTRFMNRHTRMYYRDRWFQNDFTGAGLDYFVLNLVGLLLTQLTLGIYYAWYYAKKRTFETNHEVWRELT